MKLNKKILMILFGVFFYLGIYYYFKETKLLNNDFTEFNNFELFIDINSDNNHHLENLVKKINQFDNYVTYSYVDKSYDLILHNSLKNKSISEIDSYIVKIYKHVYYLAFYIGADTKPLIDSEKYEQYSEISDIQWLTIDECRAKIRPYNISKYGIITSCENFINNYQSEFTLKE